MILICLCLPQKVGNEKWKNVCHSEQVRESQKFCLPMLCVCVSVCRYECVAEARFTVENMQMFPETISTAMRQMINVNRVATVGDI